MRILDTYPVFEKDGEEYVADTRMCLTSNPPQYNAYRLKDRKHTYVFCSQAHGKKIMYEKDFKEFMYGKSSNNLTLPVDSLGVCTITASPTPISVETPTPVTHTRPKTADERIDALEIEVKRLNRWIKHLNKK